MSETIREPAPPAPFPKQEGGVRFFSFPPSRTGKGVRGLGPLTSSPWPLFLLRAITLAGFVFTIVAGLFGSVVGSHNFAIIFVWVAWWTLLKLFFIPLGGRSWCAVCPIPLPGEWLAQGGIFPGGRRFGLRLKNSRGLRWPRKIGPLRLDGAWLQAGAFLAVGLFSAVTLTTPALTGWVLLGIFVLATVLALVFEPLDRAMAGEGRGAPRRAFCNHLCPIGGFTGLYAQAAPLEVRVIDRAVCAAHAEKDCYQACPWGVYVAGLADNSPCGMCFECIRACPKENVTVNLRAFGKDYLESKRAPRLDEAYLALVMLGCALAFSAVFLGPWGWLRAAAYQVGSPAWLLYSAAFLAFAGLLAPGLFALAVWAARSGGAVAQALRAAARPLLPLGLCAWIAFTISFAFAKAAYILPVLSDPFGRGWNLLSLPTTAASGIVPEIIVAGSPLLQAGVLLGGLLWMGAIARKHLAPRLSLAVQAYGLAMTVGMLWLLVG